MNLGQIEFLLRYAKIGVLEEMKKRDPIESESLKQEFIQIRNDLKNGSKQQTPNETKTDSDKKPSAIKNWFQGIGDRQRKYQETNKGKLM